MALDDIIKLQLKKVNPFQGLIIDADTWRDAHNYHRDQQRLHVLAFHGTGIVQGLEVTAGGTPDEERVVVISPGMAIDGEGNVIVVGQKQRYRVQAQRAGTVYLVVQFREVPTEPYQPPNGGQPTRLIDAYKIEERDKLPAEPYVELARIDFDPARGGIRGGGSGKNEIDLRFRKMALPAATPAPSVGPAPAASTVVREVPVAAHVQTVIWGCAVLGDADRATHVDGLKNLARNVSLPGSLEVNVQENVGLSKDLDRCNLLYLTGRGRFEVSADQVNALGRYLQGGGVIIGEGCATGEGQAKAAREFGLAFNQMAGQLKRKLETVKRGHPLLTVPNVFAEVPPGCETGLLLEGGRMVYSGSDYGCAWQGGRPDQPLAREAIRTAFELGANIAAYAGQRGAR